MRSGVDGITSCPACATVRLPELSLRDRRLQPAIGLQPPPTRATWVTHTTVARMHPDLTRLQATELWSEASQRHAAAATGVCCLKQPHTMRLKTHEYVQGDLHKPIKGRSPIKGRACRQLQKQKENPGNSSFIH